MEKILIGKTGRVLKAVACRVADRQAQASPSRPFELAIMVAVNRAVEKEAKRKRTLQLAA